MSRRLLLSLAFGLFCTVAFCGPVEVESYEDAMAVAKAEGKDVYVLFGGDECPWCVKQKTVLEDAEVIASLSGFVIVHVDVSERKDLADRHRVKSIPVSMVMGSDEVADKRTVGYMDKAKFLKWIR